MILNPNNELTIFVEEYSTVVNQFLFKNELLLKIYYILNNGYAKSVHSYVKIKSYIFI